MDFRRTLPDDATQIAALEAAIFPDPWSRDSVIETVCTEGAMCFTAVLEGRVIAYVLGRIIPPEGEIYRVAVDPEFRQRGVGYRLLDYAVKTSRGAGLETVFLEVRSRNVPAIALYKAYGFRTVGHRRGYYKDPPDDAIIMLKAPRDQQIL